MVLAKLSNRWYAASWFAVPCEPSRVHSGFLQSVICGNNDTAAESCSLFGPAAGNVGGCADPLDHAVVVVGFGTDDDGRDYWLVKNSWGTHWGEDGFFKCVGKAFVLPLLCNYTNAEAAFLVVSCTLVRECLRPSSCAERLQVSVRSCNALL